MIVKYFNLGMCDMMDFVIGETRKMIFIHYYAALIGLEIRL